LQKKIKRCKIKIQGGYKYASNKKTRSQENGCKKNNGSGKENNNRRREKEKVEIGFILMPRETGAFFWPAD